MRLPINPWWFFAKLLVFFLLTYLVWHPLAPYYAQLLLRASRVGIWLSEFSFDPAWQHPTMLLISPERSQTAIFYLQRNLFGCTFSPQGMPLTCQLPPQGIPAEWIMANLVLLIPLMLATPAPSWRARVGRLALALGIALVLQVFDVVMAIKSYYAATFHGAFGWTARQIYQFFDAFVQSWDTQLFPFAIWAGIHFRQLLPRGLQPAAVAPAAPLPASAAVTGTRAERRRQQRRAR